MTANLRSWWQKARKPLEVFGIIVVCIMMIVLLVVIVLAYIFNVNVPGLRGKTLWDWLQLLIIPAVLAVGGYLFNYTTSRNEQAITSDNQREAAMKEYFDKMSELMLHENLGESDSDAKVRKIARVWTLSVLRRLDKDRKASVLKFLYESGLIDKDKKIIDLSEADLTGANLFLATLFLSDLSGANLTGADLFSADLGGAILNGASLLEANLTGAILTGTNLYLAT